MTNITTSHLHWFFLRITKDALIIYTSAWFIALSLEVVKEGIISNYFSLPHTSIGILLLAVLWIIQSPPVSIPALKHFSKSDFIVLSMISVALLIGMPSILETGPLLTGLIVMAMIVAVWSACLHLKE